MVKSVRKAGSDLGHYLALATVATTLVACGGGAGDTGFVDADGDGIDDNIDDLVDVDGNGLDDRLEAFDFDNDGTPDLQDADADGDGLADTDTNDAWIDLNGDGLDDVSTQSLGEAYSAPAFGDGLTIDNSVTEIDVCGSESGFEAFGNAADWANNCTIERSLTGGLFADSLYSVGIQRILFCTGYGGTAGQTYTDFADGEYGPTSVAAMQLFQDDLTRPPQLTDDGVVGEDTWAKLQDVLFDTTLVSVTTESIPGSDVSREAYSFIIGPCAGIPMFYQDVVPDGAFETPGTWRLARNQPNQSQSIAFSIELPFFGRR